MVAALKTAIGDRLNEAFSVRDKLERKDAISVLKKDVIAGLSEQIEANGWNPAEVSKQFSELEYETMRGSVLSTKVRIDGRALDTVRPIASKVRILPRVHGSALFPLGATQALVAAPLATPRASPTSDAASRYSKQTPLFPSTLHP